MSSSLRFSKVLVAAVVGIPLLSVLACNAQLATVLSADGGGGGSTSSSSGGAACTNAASCNADPAISSLRGSCVDGRCVCNPGVATTSDGRCGDVVSTDASTNVTPCAAKGGKCIPEGASAPPSYQPDKSGLACDGTKGTTCWVPIVPSGAPVCYNDQGCNEDPVISSLLGKCVYGVCFCNSGFVQPSGKCAATPPPECLKQAGTCHQSPAACNPGELEGDNATNMTCGDLIPAACCFPGSSCKGGGQEAAGAGWVPVDFHCCNSSKVASDPICVNGWRTCRSGETPSSSPGGGC